MVKINLLPPEIIERRKYERFYPYVFATTGILLVAVVLVWGVTYFLAGSAQSDLQQIQESTSQIRTQAESFGVFEQQRQQLEARKLIADQVLAERVNMAGLAYDISLILPDEIWLASLVCNETDGITLSGYTPDTEATGLSEGYKSVAAALVRLSALHNLKDVWLTGASAEDFTAFENASEDASATVIGFDATARIATETPTAGN